MQAATASVMTREDATNLKPRTRFPSGRPNVVVRSVVALWLSWTLPRSLITSTTKQSTFEKPKFALVLAVTWLPLLNKRGFRRTNYLDDEDFVDIG